MLHYILARQLKTSWDSAGIAAWALAYPRPQKFSLPALGLSEGAEHWASRRTGLITLPVLDSVSNGPASPEGQM